MNIILPSKAYTNEGIQGRLLILAGTFLVLCALILTLSPTSHARSFDTPLRWEHWSGVLVWVVSFYFIHKKARNTISHLDPFLLPVMGLLTGWGLLSIWRVTLRFGLRQTIWLAIAASLFLAGLLHQTGFACYKQDSPYRYQTLSACAHVIASS